MYAKITPRLVVSTSILFCSIQSLDALGALGALGAPESSSVAVLGSISDIEELSLEELIDIDTSVASKVATTARESPGIVTVITRDEIANAGARDLLDVLQLVPGFELGVDVEGVVGIGVRGNWAHEGKALLLLDGHELNERLYSTIQLGNHFPVDQIERIEIVRGPGSSIYGGYAELAVINIVTKGARELRGGHLSASFGHTDNSYARSGISLAYGREDVAGTGLDLSVSGFLGQGIRSDRTYSDFYGNSFSASENRIDPFFLNAALGYRGLTLRILFDQYQTTSRDAFDESLAAPVDLSFQTLSVLAQYLLELGDDLTVTPKLSYSRQVPWRVAEEVAENSELEFDVETERYLGQLLLSYRIRSQTEILLGGEAFVDHASPGAHSGEDPFGNGASSISHRSVAVLAQVSNRNRYVNVTAGARFEHHEGFGSSFVPRLALTKATGRLSFKLLASAAFRAPAIMNLSLNPDLDPERTTVYELEAGYQLTPSMFASANLFDVTIRKPIVYFYDEATDEEGYQNYERSGTRGLELCYRFKKRWGYANLNYSFYSANGKNEVAAYEVADHPAYVLAFPAHKVALSGAVWFRRFTLSPSAVLLGERYGYLRADEVTGEELLERDPSHLILNLFLHYRPSRLEGLVMTAGAHNILDSDYRFIQPYRNHHAPLPGMSRELLLRLTYSMEI
ncbi:MAG: TonB-dependent receptor plug domain-containing protein [Pseudomonadota bacterium]